MFAVKRALKLNNVEATLMAKHAGFRRVVYNMGLDLRMQSYGEIKATDSKFIGEVKKILTNQVKKLPEYQWMNELSSRVYQNAFRDLADAFSRYRQGLAKHPTFVSKKDGQSFTVDSSHGKVLLAAGKTIKIPALGTPSDYSSRCLVGLSARPSRSPKKAVAGLSPSPSMPLDCQSSTLVQPSE
jgi:putative transposase